MIARHMQHCFLHFGMRSSKACAKKILLVIGKSLLPKPSFFYISMCSSYESFSQNFLKSKLILYVLYFVREMDLLSMPSNTGSLRLVQWPLFLLSSKVVAAKVFLLVA